MGIAVAGRQLHEAQPVAMGIETHGLGVDGDHRTEGESGRKVAAVKADRH
jgi:hypothetical protein